jgi:hypothetical protein
MAIQWLPYVGLIKKLMLRIKKKYIALGLLKALMNSWNI